MSYPIRIRLIELYLHIYLWVMCKTGGPGGSRWLWIYSVVENGTNRPYELAILNGMDGWMR